MSSPLLIDEPPLQVLPTLAIKIGLNEAIVLQQLHYLLRNPQFGRQIAEHKWIFNTIEQWREMYFPFWGKNTIIRTFESLKRKALIETCQPEGRVSRRLYYRIDPDALNKLSHLPIMGNSIYPKRAIPITKTTITKTTESKGSKETGSLEPACLASENHDALWKPDERSKAEQLQSLRVPKLFPSEREFDAFLESEQLDSLLSGQRSDLYFTLCRDKWRKWNGRKWVKIADWRKFVRACDQHIFDSTKGTAF